MSQAALLCPVVGCANHVDPRCLAHDKNRGGEVVNVCDGCVLDCYATSADNCVCRPIDPTRETTCSGWHRPQR